MSDTLEKFIALVEQKNMLQGKYLKRSTEDITRGVYYGQN